MSLVGKLAELPFSDLLRIIGANRKSGRLHLTRHDAQGVIVFRHGQIIYAATNSARETLGHLLLSEGLITEDQLMGALERQHRSADERRLGSLLLEEKAVSHDDLTNVLRQQTGKVIAEFLSWTDGFFKFDAVALVDRGEIGVDVADFVLDEGVSADSALQEFRRRLAALDGDDTDGARDEPAPTGLPDSLTAIMTEIRSPEFTGEIGLRTLEFASGVFPRAVLFFLRRRNFVGMGSHDHLTVPLDAPSILAEAAGRKTTVRGPLDPSQWHLYLISQMGGESPSEAAAVPILVNETVLLVIYGDNAGSHRPLGSLDALEVMASQAGLAMEKRLLEKRVEHFERLRGELPEDGDDRDSQAV